VQAFRSTLAEVADADLVLHVVDGSAADPEGQIEAVHLVMREIHADDSPS
jgi:GTP-binding protein HflX